MTEKYEDEDLKISPRTGKVLDKSKAPKKRRKSTKRNVYSVEKGDNDKYIQLNVELLELPEIDLHNVEDVYTRTSEYFDLYAKYDSKPTVTGYAMALGMNRTTLSCIVHDQPINSQGYYSALPKDVTNLLKSVYNVFENLTEGYLLDGKIKEITGIFLLKNHHGYQDKQELVFTPTGNNEDYTTTDIKDRYLDYKDND